MTICTYSDSINYSGRIATNTVAAVKGSADNTRELCIFLDVIGRGLLHTLKIIIGFEHHVIKWDGFSIPINKTNYLIIKAKNVQ